MTEREVRKDWRKALESVDYASQLSPIIEYGFSIIDISKLAKLYDEGIEREKILDLLTDCNFHKECGDFKRGHAESYII